MVTGFRVSVQILCKSLISREIYMTNNKSGSTGGRKEPSRSHAQASGRDAAFYECVRAEFLRQSARYLRAGAPMKLYRPLRHSRPVLQSGV